MDKFLIFTIAGLSTAAIYAIAASGLVVTYTTSGIFNFAHGAFSMMAAFMLWQVSSGWGVPLLPAALIVIFIIAPLFGAVVERVLMRGIEGAGDVVKVVVTISLMLGLMALANVIWPATTSRRVQSFFPGGTVTLFGVVVPYQRLLALSLAIIVAIVLRLVFKGTRLGIAMRAVVDDRSLLQLNGGRPGRTSMLSWGLGASMAAVAGVLIASEQSLSSTGLTLTFINAYAVAVVGRLRSLPGAFLGAIILGLAQAYAIGYIPSDAAIGSISLSNLPDAIPGIMLFVVIVLQPQSRLRAHGMSRRSIAAPAVSQRTAIIGGVALVLAIAAIASLIAPADLNLLTTGFFMTVVTLSLVPLTGFAGQISLAQITFTGLGAVAMVTWGANGSLVGVVISIVLCAAVGALVAFPALRLSGIYLALATAAFAMICSAMVFNQTEIMPGGNLPVPVLKIGPLVIDTDFRQLVLLAVVFAVIGNMLTALRRSSWGRRLTAMKDSPVACATLGLNLTSAKVGVFALSAAIAGTAGAVSGRTFVAESLVLPSSLSVTMLAVVGGIGSVAGAFIGGLLLGAAPIGASVFANNAVGVFGFVSLQVTDVLSFAPALMGLSLGREPDGVSPQLSVGFREVGKSPISLVLTAVASVVIWLAARAEVIGNWSFLAACLALGFTLVPVLPALINTGLENRRRIMSAIWLVGGVVAAAFIPWGTFTESTGIRVLAMIAFLVFVSRVSAILLGFDPANAEGATPTVVAEAESPDLLGFAAPISRSDALDAARVYGIDEETLPPGAEVRSAPIGAMAR
ncbi:MAG TPA: ABC transporter permease [Microthrixaceae bacterium]|nr:ABC transporter permease [Microthrixaceae bacterium]